VKSLEVGDFVVGSFVISDHTCEIRRFGYQSKCVHAEFVQAARGQAARCGTDHRHVPPRRPAALLMIITIAVSMIGLLVLARPTRQPIPAH
jgi:threonine dehydrogenase-like Zn-dependent dehydrogenase